MPELCWFCNELVNEVRSSAYGEPMCEVCLGIEEFQMRKDEVQENQVDENK